MYQMTTTNPQRIHFKKASPQNKDAIFSWLDTPHMKEFWDNSDEHKIDIQVFMNGRKEPSDYFGGIFTYWLGFFDEEPFCILMTAIVLDVPETANVWREHLSKTGNTYSIDFGIGNEKYIGKGLAAITLDRFTYYFQKNVDPLADTFYIDPSQNNPRAIHVYEKAGFMKVAEFEAASGYFQGNKDFLMIKKCI
jgi:RimJ/RimL family protein N-acetyltransferase